MPEPRRTGIARSRRPYTAVSHKTNLSRSVDTRDQRWTVLILSNGARTEVDYFNSLKLSGLLGPSKKVTVKFRNGTPYDTVRAASEVQDYSDFDEAWAVCDVDTFEIATAMELAANKGVSLALSQPCFEVWLIFHKTDSCPSFDNADQARRALRRYVPSWDKGNLNFADFINGISDAVVRARRRDEPPEANPSTAVWKVIVSLGVVSDADRGSSSSSGRPS
jgi:RloB-like protein